MSNQFQTNVWVEDAEISTHSTLSYSTLSIGDGLNLFIGHTAAESLVNIDRLQDALSELKHRIVSE